MFSVYDEAHCEYHGHFATRQEAVDAIISYTQLPWDSPPNRAPCRQWRTCKRNYEIHEWADRVHGERLSVRTICRVDSDGVTWADGQQPLDQSEL